MTRNIWRYEVVSRFQNFKNASIVWFTSLHQSCWIALAFSHLAPWAFFGPAPGVWSQRKMVQWSVLKYKLEIHVWTWCSSYKPILFWSLNGTLLKETRCSLPCFDDLKKPWELSALWSVHDRLAAVAPSKLNPQVGDYVWDSRRYGMI